MLQLVPTKLLHNALVIERLVQLLFDPRANANNEDEGKYNPLHLSASKGYDQCVYVTLTLRVRLDAVKRKGVTALHYAVQGRYAAVERSLMCHEAKAKQIQPTKT